MTAPIRLGTAGPAAVVAAAYAATLLMIGSLSAALMGVAVQALVMAPGVLVVARLGGPGRRWLPALIFGPAVGLGASNVALLGLWAAGGRGPVHWLGACRSVWSAP